MRNYLIKLIIVVFILGWTLPAAAGGEDAFGQLLSILAEKKVLTPDELQRLSESLNREREALRQRAGMLDQREKELDQRERRLNDGFAAAKNPNPVVKKKDKGKEPGIVIGSKKYNLRPGAVLQTDYRLFHYEEDGAARNGFDIRRAQLILSGRAGNRLGYRFSYEFQGTSSRRLLDAYLDLDLFRPQLTLRAGQFKEPFGLEASGSIADLLFAERAMGASLAPGRDMGLSIRGVGWNHRLTYALGLFSGDGKDDSTRGEADTPEAAGRLTFQPFSGSSGFLENLHLGGSFSYADVDRNNLALNVKTPGQTSFFSVSAASKFKIIHDAGFRRRWGAELGWAHGPLALMSEYSRLSISDVTTSSDVFDLNLEGFYLSLAWTLAGEQPFFKDGAWQPPRPRRSVWQGGPGAWVLAARYDWFKAHDVYGKLINPGESISRAGALSLALSWHLDEYARFILDLSRTDFDRPLLIRVDSETGEALFSDHEYALTLRLQFKL